MGVYTGDNSANTINLIGVPLGPGETGNSVSLLGGNDTFYGSSYTDIVTGGDGDDVLYGYGGGDILIGGNGVDQIHGGDGNDNLTGGAGNDTIWGDLGNDVMSGNAGNDSYVHTAGSGVDTIAEDLNEAGTPGFGSGTDTLYYGANAADIGLYQSGNTLWVTTVADAADGIISDGVQVQNFFSNTNSRIEYIVTADNYQLDLSSIV